jgi:nucleoside-diphosphate-sugar epimerase
MRRVLVTGANGFIGRRTLPLLLERGFEVHAVHRDGAPPAVPDVTWHRADLLQVAELEAVVDAAEATHLLHLAWYAVPSLYWEAPENLRWFDASLRLLERFAVRGSRAVLAGSCAEYDWSFGFCSERVTPLAPTTLYGGCKHALQSVAGLLSERLGLGFAWGRIFYLYGPGEHPARLVPSITCALIRGERAPCTVGTQVRDFLHVDDVASAFVRLLESSVGGPVNIASGRPLAVRDLLQRIGVTVGAPELLDFGALPPRPNEPPVLLADVRRLTEEVGWEARRTLQEGIEETVDWWRAELASVARSAPTSNRPAVER